MKKQIPPRFARRDDNEMGASLVAMTMKWRSAPRDGEWTEAEN